MVATLPSACVIKRLALIDLAVVAGGAGAIARPILYEISGMEYAAFVIAKSCSITTGDNGIADCTIFIPLRFTAKRIASAHSFTTELIFASCHAMCDTAIAACLRTS